jgi:lipopolysaccharide transport system ATP-binding protein
MKKKEIDRKFDEIVEFSEVEKFLDTPVKRYSSGMRVRLAFSVAAHLDAEILLVDEVLAVGDLAFQKKCLGKMEGVTREGRTVLFVSHNMGIIADLCDKCLLLSNGEVVDYGESKDVVKKYISSNGISGQVQLRDWEVGRSGNGPMRVTCLSTKDDSGRVKSQFDHGEPITFAIGISGRMNAECILGVSIRDGLGHLILHFSNIDDSSEIVLPADESEVRMCLRQNVLNNGTYYVTVFLGDGFNIMHDRVHNCLSFTVDSDADGRIVCRSPIKIPAHWTIVPEHSEQRVELEVTGCVA